jgi:hypothetical protein
MAASQVGDADVFTFDIDHRTTRMMSRDTEAEAHTLRAKGRYCNDEGKAFSARRSIFVVVERGADLR